MAKYRVAKGFFDLHDPEDRGFHFYGEGDEYPREGAEPSPERVAALLSASNRMRRPVIEEVPEAAEGPLESPGAEAPEESPEDAPEVPEEPAGPQEARQPLLRGAGPGGDLRGGRRGAAGRDQGIRCEIRDPGKNRSIGPADVSGYAK